MSESSLYTRVFEELTEGVAIVDPGTERFEDVNRAYADVLGYEPTELEGASFVEVISDGGPSDGDTLSMTLETPRTDESHQFEYVLETAEGTERRVELTLTLLDVDDGSRWLSTIRERGSEETRSRALDTTVQRLNIALAGTNTGVWEWDMETDEVIWTESMERLFGLEPGTFEGTFEAFAERVHPDDRPAVKSAIETAIEQDDVFQHEYRILRDDGEQRWGYARAETYGFEDGNGRMVGIVTDITKRKEQERRLHRQDLQYRQLVNRLPEAYYTFDRDWTLTYCNEVLADRLETSVDELIGTSVWEVIPGARGSILEETFQEAKERQEVTSCEFYVEDYEYWIEPQAYPYEDGVAVISADITDQKEKFGMVLDAMPLIFYRIDSEGVFRESRGKGLTMLGLEPGAVVGESVFDVYAANPEILEAVERTLEGEEVSLTFEVENHYFQSQFRPIVEDGDVTELIGISMDVTELERQREQMEFFNSILRHDVLNGMTIIKTRGELLADQLEGEHGRYARTIVDWCDATTAVTKRVQRVIEALTTPDEESRVVPIDAAAILRRKLDELKNAHPEVTFVGDFDSSVSVRADELLSDVLANLLSNSIEHNDTEGLRVEVTIETDADGVTIRIADNGVGIADERKEGVFRRGATSHVKETGSGFGLFFVDVMVEKYGGEVWVTDSDSGGACFAVELPKANGGAKT